jgi:uncharacterized protein with PIN domain
MEQAAEVIKRFDLASQAKPFTRCTVCNALIEPIDKEKIIHRLMPNVKANYDEFGRCTGCDRIYWQGCHYKKIWQKIDQLLDMR